MASVWPEQEAAEEWWRKHRLELKEAVTRERLRLQEENEALLVVEQAALAYCEAASGGQPTANLDWLFSELVKALGWRRTQKEA